MFMKTKEYYSFLRNKSYKLRLQIGTIFCNEVQSYLQLCWFKRDNQSPMYNEGVWKKGWDRTHRIDYYYKQWSSCFPL